MATKCKHSPFLRRAFCKCLWFNKRTNLQKSTTETESLTCAQTFATIWLSWSLNRVHGIVLDCSLPTISIVSRIFPVADTTKKSCPISFPNACPCWLCCGGGGGGGGGCCGCGWPGRSNASRMLGTSLSACLQILWARMCLCIMWKVCQKHDSECRIHAI